MLLQNSFGKWIKNAAICLSYIEYRGWKKKAAVKQRYIILFLWIWTKDKWVLVCFSHVWFVVIFFTNFLSFYLKRKDLCVRSVGDNHWTELAFEGECFVLEVTSGTAALGVSWSYSSSCFGSFKVEVRFASEWCWWIPQTMLFIHFILWLSGFCLWISG